MDKLVITVNRNHFYAFVYFGQIDIRLIIGDVIINAVEDFSSIAFFFFGRCAGLPRRRRINSGGEGDGESGTQRQGDIMGVMSSGARVGLRHAGCIFSLTASGITESHV